MPPEAPNPTIPVTIPDAIYHSLLRIDAAAWAQVVPIRFEPPDGSGDIWTRRVDRLRHSHTNYHVLLRVVQGRPGAREAAKVLRDRVNDEIGAWLDAQLMEDD